MDKVSDLQQERDSPKDAKPMTSEASMAFHRRSFPPPPTPGIMIGILEDGKSAWKISSGGEIAMELDAGW